MEVLASGTGEFKLPDPDEMRAWVREHKVRKPVDKVRRSRTPSRFVSGDMAFDERRGQGPFPYPRSSGSGRRTSGLPPSSTGPT
jgi:hypothetical protein